MSPRPTRRATGSRYRYFPDCAPVPESVAVNLRNRSHVISIEVDVPDDRTFEGVLLAQGSVLGGWTFFALDGAIALRAQRGRQGAPHRDVSDVEVPAGRHRVGFEFDKTAEFAGTGRLYVDDDVVGEADMPFVTPARLSITGAGSHLWLRGRARPISFDYVAPFRCTGDILQRGRRRQRPALPRPAGRAAGTPRVAVTAQDVPLVVSVP